jgi:putative glycosyltransferase
MKLSVVTTVYKSLPYLNEFINECLLAIDELKINEFEIIFVLDGITDNSKNFLLEKKKEVPQIIIIELSRNFGHHYAASCGLRLASGERIFLIDCDLEVSPNVLVDLYHTMNKTSADVVYGYQEKRKGKFIEKYLGGLFWKLFNFLSDTTVPNNIVTERLMNRKYLDALNSLGDKNLFLGGMMYWVGFNQIGIPVVKKNRKGNSSYSISKRINLMIEAISSFSEKPLKLLFKIGIFIMFLTLIIAFYLILKKLIYPEYILIGYTSIMTLILFSTGIIIATIGAVGIYVSKIYKQVQERPLYIIRNIYK